MSDIFLVNSVNDFVVVYPPVGLSVCVCVFPSPFFERAEHPRPRFY